jgi:hypothetical protein
MDIQYFYLKKIKDSNSTFEKKKSNKVNHGKME